MALVMNASAVTQTAQVHGSYFTFAPGQIKDMQDPKVDFLTSHKAYLGFVALPESMSDLEFRNTEEGKAILEQAKALGVANRIKHLDWLIANETKSLRNDMDKANLKSETSAEFNAPALQGALKEKKEYRAKKADALAQQVDEINKLLTEE